MNPVAGNTAHADGIADTIDMKIKVRLFDPEGNKQKFNIHVDGDPTKILIDTRKKIEEMFQKKESD